MKNLKLIMKLKKIFNLFYKDNFSDNYLIRYRSIFNIFATKYSIVGQDRIEKEYILFNKTLLKRTDTNAQRTWTGPCGINLKEDLCKSFNKKYYKYYKDYDDVYLFYINSGEVFLFLKYVLHKLLIKRKSKKPVILTSKKYHKDLVKLFYPDIPCIHIEEIKSPCQKTEFTVCGYNFTLIIPKGHFDKIEQKAQENKSDFSNYFLPIIDLYDCERNNIEQIKTKLPPEFEKTMLEKIEKINLNLNNFIFLAPEAESCNKLPDEFWIGLIKILKKRGYDIFVNLTKKRTGLNNIEFKSIFLSYGEAFALARYAKRIITLRSGICELLSEIGVGMDILYTDFRKKPFFRDLTCKQVMRTFSLNNLPGIDMKNINEIDATGDFESIYKQLNIVKIH